MRTAVRGGFVVAYDGSGHRVLRSGVVVYDDDRIVRVGPDYDGPAERTLDMTDCLVCPGFVNIHSHGRNGSEGRLILDAGRPDTLNSGYISYFATKPGARSARERERADLGCLCYLAGAAQFGATTVVDVGGGIPELVRAAERLGVRVYSGPGFASARFVDRGGRIEYEFDEARGRDGLRRAVAFIREHKDVERDLFHGMLCPHAADTCSEGLLAETHQAARDLGVRIQIHAAQGLMEFTELARRTRLTPIQWLDRAGLLDDRTILGHAVFLDHHPLAPAQGRRDLAVLAGSGAHVAHCPLVFARRGWALHSFQRYLQAGINVGLGTDVCPRNIIDEMRWAAYVCKLVEGDPSAGAPADVFNAATLGGARALGRDDLGRLAPGAKADLTAVRLDTLRASPVLDPIRSLVHHAAGARAEYVVINGRLVVDRGAVVGIDEPVLMREVQADAERVWRQTPEWDGLNRTAAEMCPPAFPIVDRL